MNNADYEKLFERAKKYGIKRGLGNDAEDFAQECVIKAFEVGIINLEYIYLNYRDYHRAHKRLLGNSNESLTGRKQVWLDAPIDSTDSNSSSLYDVIGDPQHDVGASEQLESVTELAYLLFERIQDSETRRFNRPRANAGSILSAHAKVVFKGVSKEGIHGLHRHKALLFVRKSCPFIEVKGLTRFDSGVSRYLYLWCDLEKYLRKDCPMSVAKAIAAGSLFQKWLFNSENPRVVIQKIIREIK